MSAAGGTRRALPRGDAACGSAPRDPAPRDGGGVGGAAGGCGRAPVGRRRLPRPRGGAAVRCGAASRAPPGAGEPCPAGELPAAAAAARDGAGR